MNPSDLTPEQDAAFYAAARRRAQELRSQAIGAAIDTLIKRIRGLATRKHMTEGAACHS